jgi:AraC family transcriptional regulator
MLTPVARLKTRTTLVEVSEGLLPEPIEAVTRLQRPSISLLMQGQGHLSEAAYLDDGPCRLSKVGRVLFMPPDRDVLGRGTSGKLRVVSCSFDRAYCESIVGSLANLSRAQLLSCFDVQSAFLPAALSRVMAEAMQPGFVSDALVESLGHAMLVEWSHAVMSRRSESAREERLTVRHRKIIDDYLAGLSCEAPSVADLAAACGWSERYFAKVFREHTGQSIGRYVKAVQLAKAQTYLLETDLPLKDIAFRLGFRTPSNFSVAFHAGTGETPGRFRTLNRGPAGRRANSFQLSGLQLTSFKPARPRTQGERIGNQKNLPVGK